MTSKIVVNNIEADAGVSTVTFGSEISASTFNGNIVGTSATFSGNVNVAGVLTYEDVTSVDAIGLSTFQNGIHVTGGSVGIGTDNPSSILSIAKDSGNTILELKRTNTNTTGAVGTINWTASDGHSVANMYALGDGDNEGAHLVFRTTSAAGESDPYGSNTFERLRITSSGNVGIGTDNPAHLLHLEGSSPIIQFEDSDNAANIYSLINGGGSNGRLLFQIDPANQGSDSYVGFDIDGSEKLRITSGGDVNVAAGGSVFIGNGNLVFSTSGTGIDFSAASGSAAGSTSALLDDYEEGTWTPIIAGLTLGNGILAGYYTKIGDIVHLSFRLDGGSTTSFGAMTGITGFPFAATYASNSGYLTASNPSNNWFGFTTQYTANNTGTNYIQWITSGGINAVGSNTTPFTWGSSTIMRFNITYKTS